VRLSLLPHPDSLSDTVRTIWVEAERADAGALQLSYRLTGELDQILIPARTLPERTDGLWQHTCFEAFVRPTGDDAYWEFNFSPSGEWAAYRLSGYRDGMAEAAVPLAPRVQTSSSGGTLHVVVELRTNLAADSLWHVGLSAVVEDRSGERHFWALAHPPGEPDFHSPDCFALELAPPTRP
jgi:hypothetical protein